MFDPKLKQKRAELSQNFLKNPSLGRYLIEQAEINELDTVLEVGPGSGVLTEALLQKAKRVLAVEKDQELVENLKQKFGQNQNLRIIQSDILHYKIELQEYKVFTNPPFSISSALIKKLVFSLNPPSEIYIFLQHEFAQRLLGKYFGSQLSVLVKSLYEVRIVYSFKRDDFAPVPGVDVVLVNLKKLRDLKIKDIDRAMFIKFVAYGFQTQKNTLQKSLESIFTFEQWKRLAKILNFDLKVQSVELTTEQWIGLFEAFISPIVPDNKRGVINNVRL